MEFRLQPVSACAAILKRNCFSFAILDLSFVIVPGAHHPQWQIKNVNWEMENEKT